MRRVFLFALVALFVIGPTGGPAGATFPGTNGRIFFSTDPLADLGLGNSQIYSVRPNGTGLKQLTDFPNGVNAHRPSPSPDGMKVLFNREDEDSAQIWIMNADGSDRHRFLRDRGAFDFDASWSPDGSQIAFSRCPKDFVNCGIAIANADGTGIETVVDGNWFAGTPKWSPDGRRIAFDSDRKGFLSAIWIVNLNTGHLKRLTPPDMEGFFPDWAPDGSKVLFTDNCCRPHSNIWTVEPDGSDLTRLTDIPEGRDGNFARYSPDGTQIVLLTNIGLQDPCDECLEIYVMNADGSNLHPIGVDVPYTFFPIWGAKVAS